MSPPRRPDMDALGKWAALKFVISIVVFSLVGLATVITIG